MEAKHHSIKQPVGQPRKQKEKGNYLQTNENGNTMVGHSKIVLRRLCQYRPSSRKPFT